MLHEEAQSPPANVDTDSDDPQDLAVLRQVKTDIEAVLEGVKKLHAFVLRSWPVDDGK